MQNDNPDCNIIAFKKQPFCGKQYDSKGHSESDATLHQTDNNSSTGVDRSDCKTLRASFRPRSIHLKPRLHLTKRRTVKALPVPLEELQSILARLDLDKKASEEHQNCASDYKAVNDHVCSINDLFRPDQDGDNLLMSAVIHNRLDVVSSLLYHTPSHEYLDFQNKFGQTILHLAVILNAVSLVRTLVAWGACVVSYDVNGNTPLHLACRDGNHDCVVALTTPLCANEIRDRPYYVPYQRLPQDAELRNYAGYTCLHMAAIHGHTHIMDYLLHHLYADINSPDRTSGQTLLHYAVSCQNMMLFTYLLQYRRLNVNAERYDKLTALDIAKQLKNKTMYDFLLRAGAATCPSIELGEERVNIEYDDISINGVQMMQ